VQQLSIAEGGVNYSARRYNDLKVLANKLTRELKAKLDDLDEQKKSFERIEALRKAQTEEGQRISQLQKETQTVEEEIARRVHYARQLVHVQERLKRNQIKLEAHMSGMEETVKALEKEGIEVRMLRNSLDASLSKSITVTEATQNRLTVARKERELLLEQRKGEVKNALSLQDWIKKREEAKIALALELRGDLTKEEEMFLRDQISEKVEKTKHLQKATEESQRRLQAMEDAFTKLKQITAVSSLEEMHEKFSNQRSNKRALDHDVKEAEARLVAVKAAHQRQEELYQDLKASGGGVTEFSRETINRLEESVEQVRNTYRTTRATLDRVAAVLVSSIRRESTSIVS
jgi:chromosome segregation ATPase